MAFNSNIDKITEREVVPDFYERLNTSRDIEYKFKETVGVSYDGLIDSGSSIPAPANVSEIINKLLLVSLPPRLLQYDITKIITYRMHVTPTTQGFGGMMEFKLDEFELTEDSLVYAVCESTGMEVTDSIRVSINESTNSVYINLYHQCPLIKDEYIQLYFIKE